VNFRDSNVRQVAHKTLFTVWKSVITFIEDETFIDSTRSVLGYPLNGRSKVKQQIWNKGVDVDKLEQEPEAEEVIIKIWLTSSFTCQLISAIIHHSHHLSLLHSFTPSSKPTFSTNHSHLNTPSTMDWLHDHRTRLIMLLDLYLVRFFL